MEFPRDQFVGVERRLRVNEYIAAYNERIRLPFNNSLNIELIGAYKNVRLKPRFVEDGGFFRGPLLLAPCATMSAGANFLSGYPYFTDWGDQIALRARRLRVFPILKRISSRFINFNFSKLYGELFAEAGAVGNFSRFEDIDFWSGERWRSWPNTDKFLTNVGRRVAATAFLPSTASPCSPISKWRIRSIAIGFPETRVPPLIDKWRYYFGFGL